MNLDVSQVITMITGEPFPDADNKSLTLKTLVTNALLNVSQGETINGSEKIERNSIAEKVWKAEGLVELNQSEVGKIKNILEAKNSYPVRIVAEAHRMLGSLV